MSGVVKYTERYVRAREIKLFFGTLLVPPLYRSGAKSVRGARGSPDGHRSPSQSEPHGIGKSQS